jgi:hypothetical protein
VILHVINSIENICFIKKTNESFDIWINALNWTLTYKLINLIDVVLIFMVYISKVVDKICSRIFSFMLFLTVVMTHIRAAEIFHNIQSFELYVNNLLRDKQWTPTKWKKGKYYYIRIFIYIIYVNEKDFVYFELSFVTQLKNKILFLSKSW